MTRFPLSKLLLMCGLAFFLAAIVTSVMHPASVLAEEPAQVKTIPAKEVKKEEGESPAQISREAVEKARAVTPERIYWLICLWVLIILSIILIRWQLRDDEKLYEEGYYTKEL